MKKQPKLTPWFPANVKPVRNGIYQCREGMKYMWYWDGKRWLSPYFNFVCAIQNRQWRGLASNPEVSK